MIHLLWPTIRPLKTDVKALESKNTGGIDQQGGGFFVNALEVTLIKKSSLKDYQLCYPTNISRLKGKYSCCRSVKPIERGRFCAKI